MAFGSGGRLDLRLFGWGFLDSALSEIGNTLDTSGSAAIELAQSDSVDFERAGSLA